MKSCITLTEKGEAKRDGAKLTNNSGRGQYSKGDARIGPFTIDYKEYNESFSVSRAVWAKLKSDAWKNGTEACLKLVLGKKDSPDKIRLWVVEDSMFRDMLEAWEEKYGERDSDR